MPTEKFSYRNLEDQHWLSVIERDMDAIAESYNALETFEPEKHVICPACNAGLVGQALLDGPIPMAQGRVVFFNFLRAAARRDTDSQTRRIDMVFQARLKAA